MGGMLAELTLETEHQGDFLDTRDTTSSNQLMATLNAINRRMDRDAVFLCRSGVRRDRPWPPHHEKPDFKDAEGVSKLEATKAFATCQHDCD